MCGNLPSFVEGRNAENEGKALKTANLFRKCVFIMFSEYGRSCPQSRNLSLMRKD